MWFFVLGIFREHQAKGTLQSASGCSYMDSQTIILHVISSIALFILSDSASKTPFAILTQATN